MTSNQANLLQAIEEKVSKVRTKALDFSFNELFDIDIRARSAFAAATPGDKSQAA